jgi:hypothetical protein
VVPVDDRVSDEAAAQFLVNPGEESIQDFP